MTVEEFLADSRTRVDTHLDRWLPDHTLEPCVLHAAMRYAVFAGGKRLRPAIARAACLATGGTDGDEMPAACALELLHTYSLIHDDLPALDDDDMRRGKPTLHKKYDDATAILAGDALQTHAFSILAAPVVPGEMVAALVRELADAAGTSGMVGGEIADLEAEGEPPDRARVEFIHERKTAALFRAAAVMGGLSARADAHSLEVLRRYGIALGLAFQVVDDILDETSDAETLGKSAGKDRAARKMSYPAAVGLDESRARARHFSDEAKAALAALPDAGASAGRILAELADFTITRMK